MGARAAPSSTRWSISSPVSGKVARRSSSVEDGIEALRLSLAMEVAASGASTVDLRTYGTAELAWDEARSTPAPYLMH